MVEASELPEVAKQKVLESLTSYEEEIVKEAIQKEIDYINSLKEDTKPEENQDIEIDLGESEPEKQNIKESYNEDFISKLKKSGFDSKMIEKLSKIK